MLNIDLQSNAAKLLRTTLPRYPTYTGLELKQETEKDRSRQDVINKTMLRMVRRYYHKIFLKNNKNITKLRYRNVEFSVILEAWTQIVDQYL